METVKQTPEDEKLTLLYLLVAKITTVEHLPAEIVQGSMLQTLSILRNKYPHIIAEAEKHLGVCLS